MVAITVFSTPTTAQELAHTKLIEFSPDGELIYVPYTDRGDVLPDFSNCGYMAGEVPLPEAPPKVILSPDPDSANDRPRVQAAIDRVSQLPPNDAGLRGAVVLKAGRYRLEGPLSIRASGVVLRGQGQSENGTVLVAAQRKKHTLIAVSGEGSAAEMADSRTAIVDEYVPVGARSFEVETAAGFKLGDEVIVHRPSTAEWIHAIGMDSIPERHGRVKQWKPGSRDLRFKRVITAISGNRLTVEAPIVNPIQREYGGGYVYKYRFPGRIERVGVENLRGESEFEAEDDEQHAWTFIGIDRARHCWVRNVTSRYFGYSCVQVHRRASHVTVRQCRCLDPVSKIKGGRRYSFAITGQLNLVNDCYARHGRHDFVMHSLACGPNVFVNCVADKAHSDSGPHHRWSVATLYDNVKVSGNLDVENRLWSGTGHGWAGAQMVFWNCAARRIICQKPPTAQNFAIGCKAQKATGHYTKSAPDGWWESRGKHVRPRSLYLKQLQDRLGTDAAHIVAGE